MTTMRYLVGILFITVMVLSAGCQPSREKLLRIPNRDFIFKVTVNQVPDGQPITHTVTSILADGTTVATAPLYSGKENMSSYFTVLDAGSTVLIVATKGNRKTLWMVYNVSSARFEDPRNLPVMMGAARQHSLTIRDPNVFALP